MAVPHRIRLQGPWQVVPLRNDAPSTPMEVQIPATWQELFGATYGTAVFRRTFHTPTNLEKEDRILIRLPEDAGQIVCCQLNDILLTSHSSDPLAYDVTQHLNDFNRLEIHIDFDPVTFPNQPGGLWKPVLLEIHAQET